MTQETKPQIVPKAPSIVIDPNLWNYKDLMEFSKLAQTNTINAHRKAREIIVSWDYPIDLEDPTAISKLPLAEGIKVIRTIMETLDTALEGLSVADVKVNLASWSAIDMENFLEALRNSDYSTVSAMIHEVAKIDGVKKGDTLPLAEGVMMVKAIRDRHHKMLQGKF